jgi:hypothetical protein
MAKPHVKRRSQVGPGRGRAGPAMLLPSAGAHDFENTFESARAGRRGIRPRCPECDQMTSKSNSRSCASSVADSPPPSPSPAAGELACVGPSLVRGLASGCRAWPSSKAKGDPPSPAAGELGRHWGQPAEHGQAQSQAVQRKRFAGPGRGRARRALAFPRPRARVRRTSMAKPRQSSTAQSRSPRSSAGQAVERGRAQAKRRGTSGSPSPAAGGPGRKDACRRATAMQPGRGRPGRALGSPRLSRSAKLPSLASPGQVARRKAARQAPAAGGLG